MSPLHRHLTLAAALLIAVLPMAGQGVQGEVVDAVSGLPVQGVLAELIDGGSTLSRTTTSPTGRFALSAPRSGSYSLRFRAIGYLPSSLPVSIPRAEMVRIERVEISPAPQILPDLMAQSASTGCADPRSPGGTFARIMERAATAMTVIEATISSGTARFSTVTTSHTRINWPTRRESADTVRGYMLAWPARSMDPDSLRELGFANDGITNEGWTYYGPDERVLFADWFLEGHCFRVERDEDDPDLFRVTFKPHKSGKLVDLSGSMEFDSRTMAPRRITFQHENLPNRLPKGSAGGEVEFTQVGERLWVPHRWRMYAPIANQNRTGPRVAGRKEIVGTMARMELGAIWAP